MHLVFDVLNDFFFDSYKRHFAWLPSLKAVLLIYQYIIFVQNIVILTFIMCSKTFEKCGNTEIGL